VGELTLLPGAATIGDRLTSGVRSIATAIRHPWHESSADWRSGSTSSRGARFDPEKWPPPAESDFTALPPARRQYILIREIRKLQQDINAKPAKQYSYTEWRFYLSLVGKASNCSSYAQIAPQQVQQS